VKDFEILEYLVMVRLVLGSESQREAEWMVARLAHPLSKSVDVGREEAVEKSQGDLLMVVSKGA
jgi:hypothetical protein